MLQGGHQIGDVGTRFQLLAFDLQLVQHLQQKQPFLHPIALKVRDNYISKGPTRESCRKKINVSEKLLVGALAAST